MKILITGALGHIGSELIRKIKPGQFTEVRLLDNLLTQRYCSLFDLSKKINFLFFENDICKCNLDNYLKGVDIVIHLAAITDAASSFGKEKEVEEVNLLATKKLTLGCKKYGCKLIFPSTTSVYGVQKGLVDENCPKKFLKPQSPYAVSKLKAEQYLIKLGKTGKFNFTICRFGTIFGYSIGMRFHTAVNKFIWQASLDQPITVWRTAMNQQRPYLDLNDAINSLFYIIKNNLFSKEIYNVVTLNTNVNKIISIIKKSYPNLKIKLVNNRIMNQLSYEVSNQKFKRTGFKFSGDIEKSILETINHLP